MHPDDDDDLLALAHEIAEAEALPVVVATDEAALRLRALRDVAAAYETARVDAWLDALELALYARQWDNRALYARLAVER
jgi:hypothetical protein